MHSKLDNALREGASKSLSRGVRVFSLNVYLVAAFGVGLLFASVANCGPKCAAIGTLLVLFGASYASILNAYVLYRVSKRGESKGHVTSIEGAKEDADFSWMFTQDALR